MRWYQYRLLHCLVAICLIGAVFGWIGRKIHRAERERASVEQMTLHGIKVSEDGPIWIRELLHVHFPVTKIEMTFDHIHDDGYFHTHFINDLAMLRDLERVEIYGQWVKMRYKKEFEARANSDAALTDDETIVGQMRRTHPKVYIMPRFGSIE